MAGAGSEAVQLPYIPAALGINAVRDAVAAIRCAVADDADGLNAVLAGASPGHLAGMLVVVTIAACRRAGLDEAQVNHLMPPPEMISQPEFSWLVAAGAAAGFKHLGLDTAAIDGLLADVSTYAIDHLLEQEPPAHSEAVTVGG